MKTSVTIKVIGAHDDVSGARIERQNSEGLDDFLKRVRQWIIVLTAETVLP